VRSRLAAAPGWAWLTALVVASSVVRFAFARHMVGPWIMIDEIVYSELAKSFASTGHFSVREVPTTGYGVVYPILISPAYVLFRSIPTVYTAIKAIDSLLMSLAAVPAYVLARRVVSKWGALSVALLTVAVPSTFYAGTIMTENAFYPIFLFTVLALVRAIESPSVLRIGLFLVALLVAYETRAQAVALAAAALTAPVVAALVARDRRELLALRLLYVIVVGLGLVVIVGEVLRGHSIRSLLGAYASATHSSYDPGTVAHWLLWHLAELDLYVGVLPVFALLVLLAIGPSLSLPERTIVSVTLSTVVWIGVEVAAFATQPSVLRIEERNLFYVAPLLFICLALWIERRLPRPPLVALCAGAIAVALAAAIPYERFISVSATSDTFGVLMLWSVALWFGIHAEDVRWVVGAAALVFVGGAVVLPLRARYSVLLVPLAISLLAVQPVDSRTQRASIGAVFQGITKPDRDWITSVVGTDDPQRVSVVWTGGGTNMPDALVVFENEFFNRGVGRVYTTTGPVPGGLAQTPIVADRATGAYHADGQPVRAEDVLTDDSLPLIGRKIGDDPKKGLVLYRVNGPLRAEHITDGIYADHWSGGSALFREFACHGGTLEVTLGSDLHLYKSLQLVEASVHGRLVASAEVGPVEEVTLRVPLRRGPRGSCTVRFAIPRTRVPARFIPGNTDTRRLGIRFVGFAVS
jgi:Dolichyl-phosphate-mannose-protein mannosyltransferase